MTIFTVEDLVRLRLEVCRFVNAYFQILMKLGLFWLFSLDPIVKLCMGESDRKVYQTSTKTMNMTFQNLNMFCP